MDSPHLEIIIPPGELSGGQRTNAADMARHVARLTHVRAAHIAYLPADYVQPRVGPAIDALRSELMDAGVSYPSIQELEQMRPRLRTYVSAELELLDYVVPQITNSNEAYTALGNIPQALERGETDEIEYLAACVGVTGLHKLGVIASYDAFPNVTFDPAAIAAYGFFGDRSESVWTRKLQVYHNVVWPRLVTPLEHEAWWQVQPAEDASTGTNVYMALGRDIESIQNSYAVSALFDTATLSGPYIATLPEFENMFAQKWWEHLQPELDMIDQVHAEYES